MWQELGGSNSMGNEAKQMAEVKEWLQGGFFTRGEKSSDLFGAVSLGGRMELEQEENESLGCVPIEEVEELLRKCAYELGIVYEQ